MDVARRGLMVMLGAMAAGAAPASAAEDRPMPQGDHPIIVWATAPDLSALDRSLPALAVYPDGRVEAAGRLAGRDGSAHGRIDPAEVRRLLRFIVEEQRFHAIDAETIRQRIAARDAERRQAAESGGTVLATGEEAYRGAGASLIRVDPEGAPAHEVRLEGLFALSRDHAAIDELTRLRAIELRLLRLAETIARAAG